MENVKNKWLWRALILVMGAAGLMGFANADVLSSRNLHLTLMVQNAQASNNVISNPSLETVNPSNSLKPLNWSSDKWGTNNATFTYLKNYGNAGTHSVKVDMASYTDGDAKWDFNAVTVTPGDSYNFSDWYQSNVVTQVVIDFTETNGTDYFVGLRTAPAAANWTHYSESFQVPYKAKKMVVYHLISSVGYLVTDNYSLVKFTPKGFKRPIVSLTFDNCWEHNTDTVIPILKNYSYTGTIEISTNYTAKSPAKGNADVSGVNAIKTFFADGYEISSHSYYHEVDLSNASPSDVEWELSASKAYLGNIIGIANVTDFASPFGSYTDDVVNAIKPLYLSHRTTDVGYNTQENFDPYRLTVQNVQNGTKLAVFGSWINQTVKDKSWLILVYHCVKSGAVDTWDTHLKDFQPQMNSIKLSGIAVETVAQALNETELQLPNHTTTTSTTSTSSTTSTTTSKPTTSSSTTSSISSTTSKPTTTSSTSTSTSSSASTSKSTTLSTSSTSLTSSSTSKSTSVSTATTTMQGVNTGLGSPTVTPASPTNALNFAMACPAKNQSFDCINAYANGLSDQCDWKNWTGNSAMFLCYGIARGTYTAECQAVSGTSSKCAAAVTKLSYTVK